MVRKTDLFSAMLAIFLVASSASAMAQVVFVPTNNAANLRITVAAVTATLTRDQQRAIAARVRSALLKARVPIQDVILVSQADGSIVASFSAAELN